MRSDGVWMDLSTHASQAARCSLSARAGLNGLHISPPLAHSTRRARARYDLPTNSLAPINSRENKGRRYFLPCISLRALLQLGDRHGENLLHRRRLCGRPHHGDDRLPGARHRGARGSEAATSHLIVRYGEALPALGAPRSPTAAPGALRPREGGRVGAEVCSHGGDALGGAGIGAGRALDRASSRHHQLLEQGGAFRGGGEPSAASAARCRPARVSVRPKHRHSHTHTHHLGWGVKSCVGGERCGRVRVTSAQRGPVACRRPRGGRRCGGCNGS